MTPSPEHPGRGACTRVALAAAVVLALRAGPAAAGDLESAQARLAAKDLAGAAGAFFDVLAHDPSAPVRDQAQLQLAATLRRLQLHGPALFYYQDLFVQGPASPLYREALEGLLELQETLHDPVVVPLLLDRHYDRVAFAQVAGRAAQVNYLVGELAFWRGNDSEARAFLSALGEESPLWPRARYLVGVVAARAGDPDAARRAFAAVEDDEVAGDEVRDLARLAQARLEYGLGRFSEASTAYDALVPGSPFAFEGLYEGAWASFRLGEFGKVLGKLEAVTGPFFDKRHVPEAYVIEATTYFVNCQWDRVRRAVDRFHRAYDPMATDLAAYLATPHEPAAFFEDVAAGGNGHFAVELAREVRRSRRFVDFRFVLEHLAWEAGRVRSAAGLGDGELAEAALQIIDEQRREIEAAAGGLAERRLRYLRAQLDNLRAQIDVLDFEVADAERQWLEQGREILKGRRARLPRPEIPGDQWQHWAFGGEWWRDELGSLQHSLRNECF